MPDEEIVIENVETHGCCMLARNPLLKTPRPAAVCTSRLLKTCVAPRPVEALRDQRLENPPVREMPRLNAQPDRKAGRLLAHYIQVAHHQANLTAWSITVIVVRGR